MAAQPQASRAIDHVTRSLVPTLLAGFTGSGPAFALALTSDRLVAWAARPRPNVPPLSP